MKIYYTLAAALLLVATPVAAQTTVAASNAVSSSSSQTQSAATGGNSTALSASHGGAGGRSSANNQGNNQLIQFNSEAVDLGESVPATVAPALVSTLNGTCYGSTSGSIAVAGFGGSLGKTYEDTECQIRLNANMMNALGHSAAAYEVMCQTPSVLVADSRLDVPMCFENQPVVADGDAKKAKDGTGYATGDVLGLAQSDFHAQYFQPTEVEVWGLNDYEGRK